MVFFGLLSIFVEKAVNSCYHSFRIDLTALLFRLHYYLV